MHALHQTLLPPSAIHHSLYVAHFTPSTIYPFPSPASSPVKVVGNLVVAGGQDLRVFEIREQTEIDQGALGPIDTVEDEHRGEQQRDPALDDGFFDSEPPHREPLATRTTHRLHLLANHTLHGHVTGLHALRTLESATDGLDRILVGFKDAKMAILEWSQGDIATVSLHTYERCPQVANGDLTAYTPILRADPMSRLAVLTLPEDTLAVLPLLQEVSDFADDAGASYGRDVPYSPSFVLPMADVSPSLRNLTDIHFLPGFHSPTVAFLYAPVQTWAGRLHTARDTFVVEIRTFDLSSNSSYPLLTKAEGLPSDSLYMVPAPKGLGGVVVVTTSGIIHVDQTGNRVATSVNGWFSHTSRNAHNRDSERLGLTLEGSRSIFISEKDMLLTLVTGRVHHVRFVIDGRTVSKVVVEPEAQGMRVPCPSSFASSGISKTTTEDGETLFVGCAEGDSALLRARLIPREEEGGAPQPEADRMEVDDEDDLYGDALVPSSGPSNVTGKKAINPNAIFDLDLHVDDMLEDVGRIADMTFGQALSAAGDRTNPQLVVVGGGDGGGVFNVFRRGVPITKRRVINELNSATNTWFLPVMRIGQKMFPNVPDSDRSTMLVSTDGEQSQIYALTTAAVPDILQRIPAVVLNAAVFFQKSCLVLVTPRSIVLYDAEGKIMQEVFNESEHNIESASISDPYIIIRRVDGSIAFYAGDSMARTLGPRDLGIESCIAAEVFADVTGIYRTFEAASEQPTDAPFAAAQRNGSKARGQLTDEQIRRLQEHKPAITTEKPSMELALDAGRGSQWLAVMLTSGDFEIHSLPDMTLVLRSDGLATSAATFTDDGDAARSTVADDQDSVTQMTFLPIGKRNPRPHLLVLHRSGRLNVYEAQPRFTLDASAQTRRSLAVRFHKSLTQVLSTRLPISIHPFANLENHTGAFITGQGPCWILSSEAHPVRSYALKQAAMAFGRTTHLGNMGDYFIRIEDGTFICYFPPTLNTEFAMPCDRYKMQRPYTSITYDPSSSHYVAAATMTAKFQLYDEEAEIQLGPQGETLIPPVNERSTLELLSQGSEPFRVLDGFEFKQNEIVLCLQSVNLESQSTTLGRRDFIAVGTGFNYAEDRASRGGVYIFEVVETVPDPMDPGSGFKLKLRARDDCRNPVSAIADINGYLIHSNGPKVFVKGLDYDERLMGLAFLDVMLYVTSIKVFKNLILISDLVKSVWFVGFQEDPYKLVTISKDVHPVSLNISDFLIHDGQVAFISSDQQGVMRVLEYDATDPETNAGERLLLRTEYQAGALHMASLTIARRRTEEEKYAPQTQIVYATAEGSLTTLVAVKPARYKRLQLVQDQMVRSAEHVAGLNPRAYRTVRNDLVAKPLSKGILDGQLLQHFALQPTTAQKEMMRQIGTDAVTVASDLQALGGFW